MFRARKSLLAAYAAALLLTCLACLTTAAAWADGTKTIDSAWKIHARPASETASAAPSEGTRPGTHTLDAAPWARVFIPSSYRPGRPTPVALLLHGSGDRGRTMIDAFSALAEREGVILVAPDSRGYTWDIMVKGAALRGVTRVPDWGADVQRIDEALQAAFDLYSVDPSRIAMIGFSDGAGYGLSLGANNADLFSSVIAFSPGLLMRVEGAGRGRVFIAHGDHDRTLPLEPTRDIFVPVLQQLGFNVTLRIFDGRHDMPPALRAGAFTWWLHPNRGSDTAIMAR